MIVKRNLQSETEPGNFNPYPTTEPDRPEIPTLLVSVIKQIRVKYLFDTRTEPYLIGYRIMKLSQLWVS